MRLTFLGAAGEVTGSATLLDTGRSRVLVDFGMFQGSPVAEARNRRPPGPELDALDAVVLTHAHLDHCGRLPILVKRREDGGCGYRGSIWATPATIELASIILRDSAAIQEADAQRMTRGRERRGRGVATPLYTTGDVERVLALMKPLPYAATHEIAHGVSLNMADAGHILGSASLRLHCRAGGQERAVVFSGDIGVKGTPILRDPVGFDAADALVLESTYGDREHRPLEQTIAELRDILNECRHACGKVLVPAFAVGRTQTLIALLGDMRRANQIPDIPVYIDSPMAHETTALYRGRQDLYDTHARELIADGNSPLAFPGMRFTRTADESRALNEQPGPMLIIAASGMCNAGRILHHLRHNLWKPATQVLIVGYQAQGTLGRALIDGARSVRIMHETISVKARIRSLGGLSAHAGRSALLEWAAPMLRATSRPRVMLNHGEDRARQSLAAKLQTDHSLICALPHRAQTVEI